MHKAIEVICRYGKNDNWTGKLIASETDKIHATMKIALRELSAIMQSPNATDADRSWARQRFDDIVDI